MNATATALRPVCATPGCGAVLSTYRPRGETLCGACRRRASEDEQVAPRVDLERLVAGILLTSDALRPGEPVNVGLELAAYGVATDCWTVQQAVRHAGTRHGIITRGRRGRPGYTVTAWERRYRFVAGFGGAPMDRDPATGKWRRLLPDSLPQTPTYPEELPGQLSLLGSDGPTGEDTAEPET